MPRRRDSAERRAALAASADLAMIRAAARAAGLSVRRMRYRVGGSICYVVQEHGTPYREWGQHGALFFDEAGRFSGGVLFGAVVPVRLASAHLVTFGLEHGGIPGSTYRRARPEPPPPPPEPPRPLDPPVRHYPPDHGRLRSWWNRRPFNLRRRASRDLADWPPTWAEQQRDRHRAAAKERSTI